MICPNCKQTIPDDAKFCGLCGALISRDNASEAVQATNQTITTPPPVQQNIMQSTVPPVPPVPPIPPTGSEMPQRQVNGQNSNNKKKAALIAGAAAALVLVIVLVVVLFVFPGFLRGKEEAETTAEETTEEKSSSSKEEKKSSSQKEEKKGNVTEKATRSENATLKRGTELSSTENPTLDDFAWVDMISDDSYNPTDYVSDLGELAGTWKGYISGDVNSTTVRDSVVRLFNADIMEENGNLALTINWYQFIADGVASEENISPQVYVGNLNAQTNTIVLDGDCEGVEIYSSYYENGNQRIVGTFTFQDGEISYFILTRP